MDNVPTQLQTVGSRHRPPVLRWLHVRWRHPAPWNSLPFSNQRILKTRCYKPIIPELLQFTGTGDVPMLAIGIEHFLKESAAEVR